LIKAGLLSASGAALSHAVPTWAQGLGSSQASPLLDAAARRGAGFPIPASQWHGESSIGAALRTGGVATDTLTAAVQQSLGTAPGGPRLRHSRDGSDLLQTEGPRVVPRAPLSDAGRRLRARFPHLRRHFAFEYYPWYSTEPMRHWDEAGHRPPASIASTMMPALGIYHSGQASIIEQHARWIADAGVGTIALSWWGRDSYMEPWVPLIMDVMRAHDIHVTFHLEPYQDDRAHFYADDVLYLLREYGERRRWENFLLLERADGTSAPVFKTFRTILPRTVIDCLGRVQIVPDYTEDAIWRQQTDTLRETLHTTFPGLTLLADSLDIGRTRAGGFDGIAIYDSYVRPSTWASAARDFGANDLLYSFALNCGFSGYLPVVPRGECDIPLPFEPPVGVVDWNSDTSRLLAEEASRDRVLDSLETTLDLQADPALFNARSGFFLTYVNTFNEWHEGTSFEPAKHRRDLTAQERAHGYHNPDNGAWRLELLQAQLRPLISNR
jgi:hypothetical protein